MRARVTGLGLPDKRYGFLRVAGVSPEDFLAKCGEIRHTHFGTGIEWCDKPRLEVNLRIHLIGVYF
jgi:hypothetical protein